MANKKNQHLIPSAYLKSWGDSQFTYSTPHVWVFDNLEHTCEHYPTTNKIFTKYHFYTLIDENNNKNLEIEDAFARHEHDFYKVRDEKIFKNKKIFQDEHIKVCIFIAMMLNRTEQGIEHISCLFASINKGIDKTKITKVDNKITDYDKINQVAENPIKYGLRTFIEGITPKLMNLDMVVYTTNEDIGFITSDNPCVWHDKKASGNHYGKGMKSESLNIALPISPNHCIVMKPKQNETIRCGYQDIDDNPTMLLEINRLIYSRTGNFYISNSNQFNKDLFFLSNSTL